MSRYLSPLFMVFFVISAAPAQSAEIRYTAVRDPFASPMDTRKGGENPAAGRVEEGLRSLVVQGIVASAANSRAIIDGKIYRLGGEPIPGVRITRIVKEGVFVTSEGKETLLSRPAPQPAKEKNAYETTENTYPTSL